MISKEPLISVIIPVYNAEKTLEQCVNSILNQTYAHTEILLINDGSTDNSSEICDNLSNQHDSVRVIHQSNKGPNAARNKGIQNSNGEYVVFADADDEFYSNSTLADNIKFFEKDDQIDIVSFPQYREFLDSNTGKISIKRKIAQFHPTLITNKAVILTNWFTGRLIEGLSSKIYKRSIFTGWSLFEKIRFTEDIFSIPDLVERCNAIQISGVGGYLYKYNEFSSIHSEYTIDKRYSQLSSEIKIYSYLLKFKGVDSYQKDYFFKALENSYYLIGTQYEKEVLQMALSLNSKKYFTAPKKIQQLICIMIWIFGIKRGLKITHKILSK